MIDLEKLREMALVGQVDSGKVLEMLANIAEQESETQEQCRINGMGSEREAALLSRIAQLEKDAGLMKDCVGSLRFIRDTFQNDLNQGYITNDKQFCVEMAKPYLEAIDKAMEASNG